MTYQSHIKSSYLKSLVQADTSCQQKINDIEKLLGLPLSDSVDSQETIKNEVDVIGDNTNEDVILDKRLKAHERILEGLSGKSEKIAKALLQRIESVDNNLSYDYNNLEISINSEVKRYSSIRSLIHRTVQAASPNLPLHFTEFINALLMSKTPVSLLINSDALNIRQALLQIYKAKKVALEGNIEVNASDENADVQTGGNEVTDREGEENVDDIRRDEGQTKEEEIEGGTKSNEDNTHETKKRKRDEENEDENEVRESKRKKTVTFDDNDDVSAPNKRKRKREEKGDDEIKVNKKKKSEKKPKTVTVGERRSNRLQLKENLKKDWLSNS